jgi:hypothetical protein
MAGALYIGSAKKVGLTGQISCLFALDTTAGVGIVRVEKKILRVRF